jgi:hypothetical protein
MIRLVLIADLVVLAACATSPALDIELVPDPNVNDEAQIVDRVQTLVLIFDSPEGLYLPGEERVGGSVQVVDADADPSDLELVATLPMGDHLPIVRLEQGDLLDASIDVRILGESAAGPIAEGRLLGARFTDSGEVVRVPFNIRPEHLPPRVGEVIPNDGVMLSGCTVPTIVVMFSKPVDPMTLFLPDAIVFEPGGAPAEIRVDATGVVAQIEPPPITGADTVSYRLRIEPIVTDASGTALDQIAAEPSSQPYVGDFTLHCGPISAIPDPPRCGFMDPPSPLDPVCPGMPRLMCIDDACVPSSCDAATCEEGLVCDPASGTCGADCRLYGEVPVCPGDRPTCDGDLGVCVP